MLGGNLSVCSEGCGTVFELMPSANGQWREKVLYVFQGGTDGANPSGNLVFDEAGNLYGTTVYGGTSSNCYQGCGTVFELSPNSDSSWKETVLYRFQGGADASGPAGLIFDRAGNLYGASSVDVDQAGATVFELSPPRQKGGAWTEQIIATFSCCGEAPNAALAWDGEGKLIGTTQVNNGFCNATCGQVFELTLAGGNWVQTSLYAFRGEGNGANPMAGVIFDGEGNLYGTTRRGGNNFGIAYELKHKGHQWSPALLYNFCSTNNCADGAHPEAGLVFDKAGNLYGTTYDGGTGCGNGYRGCGTVFELTHAKSGWRETVLYHFTDDPRGSKPAANLIFDNAGNLYGTTVYDAGGGGYGTVFEITP